jgi:hypothetical protein
MPTGPPAGRPYDQLADDGCPLTPDPARDDEGRDNLGAYDTFDDAPAESPDAPRAPAGSAGA